MYQGRLQSSMLPCAPPNRNFHFSFHSPTLCTPLGAFAKGRRKAGAPSLHLLRIGRRRELLLGLSLESLEQRLKAKRSFIVESCNARKAGVAYSRVQKVMNRKRPKNRRACQ